MAKEKAEIEESKILIGGTAVELEEIPPGAVYVVTIFDDCPEVNVCYAGNKRPLLTVEDRHIRCSFTRPDGGHAEVLGASEIMVEEIPLQHQKPSEQPSEEFREDIAAGRVITVDDLPPAVRAVSRIIDADEGSDESEEPFVPEGANDEPAEDGS